MQIVGRKTNVAIIISIPVPAKLNDTNFIAVAYVPETANSILRVGDIVDVRGIILSVTANKLTVNFIHASNVVKTGIMPITDPDFGSIIQVIQQDEKTQNNMFWGGDVGIISTGDSGDSGGDEGGDGGGDGGD